MASKPRTFEQVLKLFVTATRNSQKYALELSHMAITTFAEHGDLSRAQTFLENMPQNYLRKQAFVAWLVEFAPVKIEGGKFVKDREREDKVDLEKALSVAFWDFAPEKPIIDYSLDDAKTQVIRLATRFESAKYHAEDEMAADFVKELKKFATTYRPKLGEEVQGGLEATAQAAA